MIVTGAARGIGSAIAKRFHAEGASVMLLDKAPEPPDGAMLDGRAWSYQADVAQADEVGTAIDVALARWGRIDVLVNNAGVGDEPPLLEMSTDTWNHVIGINLTGAFVVSQRVGRAMVEAAGGVILHTVSIDALGADGPCAAYSASKAGLLGLNRTMALELAPHGIRVNAVSPGYTYTGGCPARRGISAAAHR